MDMLLVILLLAAIGGYKIYNSPGILEQSVENDCYDTGAIGAESVAISSIPVGSNLMLKRERDAFMYIVLELGVK